MNIVVSQSVIDTIPRMVSTLKKMGFPLHAVENCKTGIVTAIIGHFRNLSVNMPGYCYYDIPGQKYRFIFRYKMSKDRTKALLTGVSIGERQLHEQKRNVIRLTEADIRHCVRQVLLRALNEIITPLRAKSMKIGEYDAVDGIKLETWFDGIEDRCPAYGLRTYYNEKEIYAIFQRCSNGKYFYGKVVWPSGRKGKPYWIVIPRKSVPKVILNDFPQLFRTLHHRQEQASLLIQ